MKIFVLTFCDGDEVSELILGERRGQCDDGLLFGSRLTPLFPLPSSCWRFGFTVLGPSRHRYLCGQWDSAVRQERFPLEGISVRWFVPCFNLLPFVAVSQLCNLLMCRGYSCCYKALFCESPGLPAWISRDCLRVLLTLSVCFLSCCLLFFALIFDVRTRLWLVQKVTFALFILKPE